MNIDFFICIRKGQRQRNRIEIIPFGFDVILLWMDSKIKFIRLTILFSKNTFHDFQFFQHKRTMLILHDIQLHDRLLTGDHRYITAFKHAFKRNIADPRRKHSLHILFFKGMNTAIRFSQHRAVIFFTEFNPIGCTNRIE